MSTYKGIDVSHHNGSINWGQVASSGIQFAIAKATQGTTFKDPMFTTNVTGANQASVSIGAYHYGTFSNEAEAQQEATFFLSVIKNVELTYAVALDLEETNGASVDQLTASALVFINEVKNAGYTCLLYTGKFFLENNLSTGALSGVPLWIARYNSFLGMDAAIWQYTDSGQVTGINGDVDLNTAYEDLTVGSPPVPPQPPIQTYTVLKTIPGYTTAANAASNTNAVTTVSPGTYNVFNTSQGMINVTTQPGVPGSWINPNDNTNPPPPTQTYTILKTIPGYTTATNAANHTNAVTTVSPGTYNVFNTSQGMINVTNQPGVPGSWINPSDNTIPPPPPPSQTYTVNKTVPGFTTADNAANHTNQVTTVSPGNYYVFNTSQGMINVTTQAGVPGTWINPSDNVVNSNNYYVNHTIPGYLTASDAANNTKQRGTVSPGSYFVFNRSQGMINVTDQSGEPGSWINPNDN